ncbi:hypothetical protein [Paludisphaera soli]|uniref:hypothetical protein n=1 Tax=Paludisphaera soli TaxID=2712865 RepID=UPI0013EC0B79|nr:hypothetical protein [Paludisphaera soli]
MPSERSRAALAVGLVAWTLLAPGCWGSGAASLELVGPEALARLPRAVASQLPDDVVLCLDETGHDGDYRLWILRRPEGSRLQLSPKLKGLESHEMPASALRSLLVFRMPTLDLGGPSDSHCRLSHWRLPDGAEIQIREIVTEKGWFASVERVAL